MTLGEMIKYLDLEEDYTMSSFVHLIERKRKLFMTFSRMGRFRSKFTKEKLDKYNYIYDIIQSVYPEWVV
jgi:hypothetical protein